LDLTAESAKHLVCICGLNGTQFFTDSYRYSTGKIHRPISDCKAHDHSMSVQGCILIT